MTEKNANFETFSSSGNRVGEVEREQFLVTFKFCQELYELFCSKNPTWQLDLYCGSKLPISQSKAILNNVKMVEDNVQISCPQ